MTPLPLFNLQDFQCPSTFTVTPSKDRNRNVTFWIKIPRYVLDNWKVAIKSKDQLALIQHVLLVRRNKFKVDLWFDGPKAEERRDGLNGRLSSVTDDILKKQPVYQDFR